MTVKLRYKAPDGDESRLITVPVKNRTAELSANVGFAAAVAEFGMLLRQSEHRGSSTFRMRLRSGADSAVPILTDIARSSCDWWNSRS